MRISKINEGVGDTISSGDTTWEVTLEEYTDAEVYTAVHLLAYDENGKLLGKERMDSYTTKSCAFRTNYKQRDEAINYIKGLNLDNIRHSAMYDFEGARRIDIVATQVIRGKNSELLQTTDLYAISCRW